MMSADFEYRMREVNSVSCSEIKHWVHAAWILHRLRTSLLAYLKRPDGRLRAVSPGRRSRCCRGNGVSLRGAFAQRRPVRSTFYCTR